MSAAGGLTIPEITDRGALEYSEEEIEDRECSNTGHGDVYDDLQNSLDTYSDKEYSYRETDKEGGQRIE